MIRKILSLISAVFLISSASAQVPEAGYLVNIHKLTTVQADTISNLEEGMLCYNTDSNKLAFYDGSTWVYTARDIDSTNELVDSLRVNADSTYIYQKNGEVVSAENAPRVYMGTFYILATGNISVTGLPFKPNLVKFTGYANVDTVFLNADNQIGNNDNTRENSFGFMTGYAQKDGAGFTQQTICGGGNGNSINDISRYASDLKCLGIRYGNQNGDNVGETLASFVSFNDDGFTINVDKKDDNVLIMFTAYR